MNLPISHNMVMRERMKNGITNHFKNNLFTPVFFIAHQPKYKDQSEIDLCYNFRTGSDHWWFLLKDNTNKQPHFILKIWCFYSKWQLGFVLQVIETYKHECKIMNALKSIQLFILKVYHYQIISSSIEYEKNTRK